MAKNRKKNKKQKRQETHTLVEWAKRTGISPAELKRRIEKGMPLSGATATDIAKSVSEASAICREQYFGDSRAIGHCIEGAEGGEIAMRLARDSGGEDTPDEEFKEELWWARFVCGDRVDHGIRPASAKNPCEFGVDTFEKNLKHKSPNLAARRGNKRKRR